MTRLEKLFGFLHRSIKTDGNIADGNVTYDKKPPLGNSVALLREKFNEIDTDCNRTVTVAELVKDKLASLENGSEELDMDLLLETTKFRYASLGHYPEISEDEWVHFRMLLVSSPSWVAMQSVNKIVRNQLTFKPNLLSQLLEAFSLGDVNGDGKVPKQLWPEVFGKVCEDEDQVKRLCGECDFNEDSVMDYYEFVARLFVGDRHCVQLAMYDISRGKAQWIPSDCLSGHKFEYIYHTGVIVYGKEYWYGGGVFESEPGTTPFRKPVNIITLGLTLRRQEELHQYIIEILKWEYNYSNYDFLHHNCNVFSDAVVQFLLNGKRIPEEVRMQPVWAENGVVVSTIKPLLNHWLGGFGQGDDDYGTCRIDDMIDVWRSRLQAGDLAMWRRRFIDYPDIVRIIHVDYNHLPMASVLLFSQGSSAPEEVSKSGVSLRELHPLPGHTNKQVFDRKRSECPRPSCALGHPLEPPPTLALIYITPCNICGNETPRHRLQSCSLRRAREYSDCAGEYAPLRCKRCKFEMCSSCVGQGCRMQGGHNGGVFSDILTGTLAAEVLELPQWLRFKAQSYFNRADLNRTHTLDREELGHLGERLCQELGLPPLVEELDAFCSEPKQGKSNLAKVSGGPAQRIGVDFDMFLTLFRAILFRAVGRTEKVCMISA